MVPNFSWRRWLSSFTNTRSTKPLRKRSRPSPERYVEKLEDRVLPAYSSLVPGVFIGDGASDHVVFEAGPGGLLKHNFPIVAVSEFIDILGESLPNPEFIALLVLGIGYQSEFDADGTTIGVQFIPATAFTVTNLGGDDIIEMNGIASLVVTGSIGNETIILNGTGGDDDIDIDSATVTLNGFPMAYAGIDSIQVNGSDGDDTVTTDDADAYVTFNGDAGDDSLEVTSSPSETVTFDGGTGFDTIDIDPAVASAETIYRPGKSLAFDGVAVDFSDVDMITDLGVSAVLQVNALGSNAITFVGGVVNSVTVDDNEIYEFDAKATLNLNAGDGADSIDLQLSAASVGPAAINIDGGASEDDQLTVNGTLAADISIDLNLNTITGAALIPALISYTGIEGILVNRGSATGLDLTGSDNYEVNFGDQNDEGTIQTDTIPISFRGFSPTEDFELDGANTTVVGTSTNDDFTVANNPGQILTADRPTVTPVNATSIGIEGTDGDDTFLITSTDAAFLSILEITGGDGLDTLIWNTTAVITSAMNYALEEIELDSNINTAGVAVTLTGDTHLTVPLTISTAGGAVVFDGTVDGAQPLTVSAGAGDVEFRGEVGGDTAVTSVTVTTSGALVLGPGVRTSGGNIDFSAATGGVRLGDDSTLVTNGGTLQVGSPVNATSAGGESLTIDTGAGNITMMGVGTTTPLDTFRVADGGTFTANGNIVTSGAHTIDFGGVTLVIAVAGFTLDATGGGIDPEGADVILAAVNADAAGNNRDLTILTGTTGRALLTGVIGSTRLDGLTITGGGGTQISGNISAGNGGDAVTFNSDVMLLGSIALNSDGTADGQIIFNGTVNGAHDLVVTAGTSSIAFNGAVGASQRLGDGVGPALIITEADADVTFNGAVSLASGMVTLDAETGVTFNENVDILAGNFGTVFIGDQVTLNGLVFSSAGNVTFGDGATDVLTLAGGAVTISTAAGGATLTFDAEVQGAQDLTIATGTGQATFNAEVGNAGANEVGDGTGAAITILSGTTVFVAQVDTNSGIVAADGTNVTFQSDVNIAAGDTASGLSGNVTLSSLTLTSNGAITLGNSTSDQITLSGGDVSIVTTGVGDNLVVNGKLDGANNLALTVAGSAIFNAPVGSQTRVGDGGGAAVAINSTGTTTFASTLATTSGITQAGGAGVLTFQDDVNIANGNTDTTFNANVIFDGLTFTSDGPVTIGDAAADTLLVSADTVLTTPGDVVTGNSATTLTGNFTISCGVSDIIYNGTINGNQALVFNSASVTRINGTIGGITPIASITTDAPGTTELNANITAQGNTMTFNDSIVLISSITLTDVGNVTFNSNLDGAFDLTLDVDGTTRFVGAVGSGTPLGDGTGAALIFNSTGPTIFESTLATASGITQAENAGVITLRGDASFGNGNTNTTFNGSVVLDGLTVTAADPISFGSDETDSITLSGGTVTVTTAATNVTQTYNGKVNGSQDLAVDAGTSSIAFNASLGETQRIGDGVGPALTIIGADADVTFSGTVSLASGLVSSDDDTGLTFNENVDILAGTSLTTLNGDQVVLNGLTFTSAGEVNFGNSLLDILTLAGDAVTISTAPGSAALTFNGEVQGAEDLTIATGTGLATFNSEVGNAGATKVGDGIGPAITILSGNTIFVDQVDTNSGILTADGTIVVFSSDVNIDAGNFNTETSSFLGDVIFNSMTISSDGAITLGNSSSDQITVFGGAVTINTTSVGDNLVVNGKVDGSRDLTLNVTGSTVFNAPVGSQSPLGDGTGAAITIDSAGTTTFASTLGTASGIIQVGAAGTLTFQDNVNLGDGDTNTTFDANVIFDGLIFTANDAVTMGDTTTDTLLVSGLTLFQTTNDLITVNSATTLDANFTVDSGSANTVYNGTIDGNHALVLNSTGTTRINGVIGGVTPVASLTTNAGGTTELNASVSAQGNTMTYNDPVVLISSITLTDVGNVTFNSTLDGAFDLTLNVDGTTRFVGAVGTGTPLGDGTGAAMIFNSTGPSIFENRVTTGSGITQAGNAGVITFRGNATFGDGDTNTTLNGSVVLDDLIVTAADPISFGSDETDSITLSGGPVLVTTAATNVTQTFNGKVNGSQDLILDAGTSSIVFRASLGETQRIGDGIGAALNIIGADADVTFFGTVSVASGIVSTDADTGLTFNEDVDILAGNTPTVLTGDQVILNGLTFVSEGPVTFGNAETDVVTLSGDAVTITTAPGNANLIFNSEVQGGQDLTIATGTGISLFNAEVGNAGVAELGDGFGAAITILSGSAFFAERVDTNSGIVAADGTLVLFSSDVNIEAGPLGIETSNFSGNVILDGMTLTSDGAITLGNSTSDQITLSGSAVTITTTGIGDNLVVNGKLDGAQDLTLNVAGSSVFNAPVGSQTPIGDGTGLAVTINSTGATAFASTLTANSGITQADAAGSVTFRDDVVLNDGDTGTTLNGAVFFDGLYFVASDPVTIGNSTADTLLVSGLTTLVTSNDLITVNSATTLDANFTVSSGTANIVYNGTINGNHALVFNSAGFTRINGVIGGITPINSITTDAPGITELNANITAQGNTMTFNDPVVLISSITLTDVGNVTFNSTVNGAFDLTLDVDGTTRFVGAVGAGTPLGDGTGAAITINSTGPTIFESSVTTNSGITQAGNAGPVTFRGDVTLGNGDTNTTLNGDVVLDGLTIVSADPISFGDDETDAITLSGGQVTVITLDVTQTYNGKVNGSQDLIVDAGTSSITFNASLGETQRIGDGAGPALLILSADADVTFNGTVSLASGLTSADAATGLIFNENVDILAGDTSTTIFGDQVTLNGLVFSSAGAITFGDAATDVVTLAVGAVTISTAPGSAALTFNAEVQGGQDLTIATGTGQATFNAEVGDAGTAANEVGDGTGAAITLLSGTTIFVERVDTNSGIVAADGTNVTFRSDVNIEAGDTASALSGNVTLDGMTLTSDGAITLGNSTSDQITISTSAVTIVTTGPGDNLVVNGKLDGAQDLTLSVTGSSVVNAPVGSQTAIGDGTGLAVTINSTGPTTFASTLNTNSGMTQAGTAGVVTFQDNVNLGDGDTNTTFNANVIFDGLIFTANDPVTVGDATTDTLLVSGLTLFQTTNDLITVNSATTLDANFTVSSGTANIIYNGTINGNHALVFNSAGVTRINGVIGGITPINSITTDAPGSTELNANITAQGNTMTFNDPVLLISSITLTDVGNVTFNNTLDGAFDLTLNVGGTTRFVSAVGGITPLGDGVGPAMIFNSTGPSIFESTLTTNSGITQAGNAGSITLRGNATFGNGDTNTTFNGSVVLDGLTVTSADPIFFGSDETDSITLSGGAVTVTTAATNVTQTFNGKVNGSQDLIVDAGTSSITFNASLGETQRIGDGVGPALNIVGADSDVTFNGTVNLASGLQSLDGLTGLIFNENVDILAGDTATTINGDQVTLNGLVFSSAGNVTFGNETTDIVTLAVGAVTISTAPGSAALTFNAEVQGAQDLTIATGTGLATFNAEVGNAGATEVGDGIGAAITILSGTSLFVERVDTNSGIVAADGTNVTFRSDVNIEAGDTASALSGDVTLDGMTLTSDGAITLGNSTSDQITISTSAVTIVTTGPGDNLVVNGKLDGAQDLTLSVTGSSVFNAPVGSQTAIGDGTGLAVTINSTGPTTFASTLNTNSGMTQAGTAGVVTFQDNVVLGDGDTNTTFNANVIFDGLIFTANDPVTVGDATTDTLLVSGLTLFQTTNDLIIVNSATTLDANFTVSSGTANIIYNGTINGNHALVFNSAGITRINGVIGGITPINSITTDAPGTTELNANITAQGNTMTFNDPVLLISSITLTDVGNVTFNNTLDGAFDLTMVVGGTTRFVGAVGGVTPLGDGTGPAMIINSTGPSIFESTLTTNSGITQAENAGVITLRGDATFGNGDTNTTFNGSVVLDGLTVTAADPISFGSDETDSITLSGGPVTVTTAATNVTQTYNGKVNGSQDLIVDAGTSSIVFHASLGETQRIGDGVGPALNIIGADSDVTFNGTVSLASGLSSLDALTGLIFNENVDILAGDTATTINGDQVTLNGLVFSSAGNVTFGNETTDIVTLAVGAVTISTAPGSAALTFNAEVQGAQDLTIATGTGLATFNAEVGNAGATEVGDGIGAAITILSGTSLFVERVDTNSGIVAADGTNVTFRSDVNIEAGDTASALSGDVTLDGMTLTSDGAITLGNSTSDQITISTSAVTIVTTGPGDNLVVNGKLDGAQDLTLSVTGSSVFNAPVGSQTAIGDGTGLAVTINSTGPTTFASTLNTNSGMTQAGTAGVVTFQDNVVLGDGDTNTTFNANVIFDGLIFTANDPVTVGDATTDTLLVSGLTLFQTTNDLITVNSATTLDANFTVSSGTANIIYNGTINGNHALVFNSAGITRINGVIGGITPINSITTDAPGTTELNANITAQGNTMTFNDPVLLISSITLTDVGNVTFNSTLDGAFDLTLVVGGTTRFVGAVGGATPLGDGTGPAMIINSTGPSIFESTLTTNSGITQAENAGVITLRGNATFGNGDTNTTFNGSVVLDGLTVTAADPISFGSDETDSITLSGGSVTVTTAATNVTQTYNGKVNGSQDLIVDAGTSSITFNASLGETQRIGDGVGPALNIVSADAGATFFGFVSLASGLSSFDDATPVTFNENVNILAGDTPTVINANALRLNGLVFSSQGNVTLTDDLTDVLTLDEAQVTINTAVAGTNVTINGRVRSNDDGESTLAVDAGNGNVVFEAAIGDLAANSLAALQVHGRNIDVEQIGAAGVEGVAGVTELNAFNQITFDGTIYNANEQRYTAGQTFGMTAGAATTFTSSADDITFNTGTIDLANGSDLIINSNGGDVTTQDIRGTSSEDVTITAGAGTASVGAIGNADEVNTVAITAANIILNGNITTSNAAGNTVTLTGAVELGSAVFIDTNTAGVDGNVTITGPGTVDGAHDFQVDAGTATITIAGTIGAGVSTPLDSLDLDAAVINLASIGTPTEAGVIGTTDVNATTALNFTGVVYHTNVATYTGPIGLSLNVNAGAPTSFITSDDALTFAIGTIELADGSDLTITANGGAVTILAGIDGTSSEDVTISSSGGTVNRVSVGQIGTTTVNGINTVSIFADEIRLSGNITTSNAPGNNVTIKGDTVLDAGIVVTTDTAANDGNVTFNGRVDGAQTLLVDAGTGGDVSFLGVVGGVTPLTSLTVAESNQTRLVGAITTGVQSYTSDAGFAVEGRFQTTGANVTFTAAAVAADVTLTADTLVTTGSGGGDITFGVNVDINGLVEGAETLSLNAGTGNITLQTVGIATPLKSTRLLSANNASIISPAAGTSYIVSDISADTESVSAENLLAVSFTNVTGTVTVTGSATGADAFTFEGAKSNDVVVVTGTSLTANGQLFSLVNFSADGQGNSITVNGFNGDDTTTVTPAVNLRVFVNGGNPDSGSDVLNFNTAVGPTTINLGDSSIDDTGIAGGVDVFYTGIETINLDSGNLSPTVVGTIGDDDLTVLPNDFESGTVFLGNIAVQAGTVLTPVAAPIVNYFNTNGNALKVDLAAGQDTLIVVGNSTPQTFGVNLPGASVSVDDAPNGVGNDGLVTYINNESLAVYGLQGDDAFNVTMFTSVVNAADQRIPLFIDGGDPIGQLPGDVINLNANGNGVIAENGPESDEGGFQVATNAHLSFDHIEAATVVNAMCALVLGTNADDSISIIARTALANPVQFAGADGVQDFTSSVNSQVEILWLNVPELFVDALGGDDLIVIHAPAPNNAAWDMEVSVAGGTPSDGEPSNGDRLIVETPFQQSIVYTPTGSDTGTLLMEQVAANGVNDGTDTLITIGSFLMDCDNDGINEYRSSDGGVEVLDYDGEGAGDNFAIVGTAGDDTIVHTPGAGTDEGTFRVNNTLPINYQNLGAGTITVDGRGNGVAGDTLVAQGTDGSDTITVDRVSATQGRIRVNSQLPLLTGSVPAGANTIEHYVVDSLEGDDAITINYPLATGVTSVGVNAGGPGGSDTLTINGAAAAVDAFVITPAATPGNGNVAVNAVNNPYTGIEHLYVNGNAGDADTLLINDDGHDNTWDVSAATAGDLVQIAGRESMVYNRFSTVTLTNGAGTDLIRVAPSNLTGFTNSFTVNGDAASPIDDTLQLLGTAGADVVTSTATAVTVNGVTITAGVNLAIVKVSTFAGNDNISLSLNIAGTHAIVEAGDDNDVVNVAGISNGATLFGGLGDDSLTGGSGADLIYGGSGNDLLLGGAGVDQEYGEDGDDQFGDASLNGNGVVDDAGADFFFGGGGADKFIWEPGDGSDIIDGGDDQGDVLRFLGSAAAEGFLLSANAANTTHLNVTLGGATVDTAGVEQLVLNAGAGADAVTAQDLTPTELVAVNIDLGAGDADTVTVNGRTEADNLQVSTSGAGAVTVQGLDYDFNISSVAVADTLIVNGNDGNDSIKATNGVENTVTIIFNGNEGNDFLSADATLNGGNGDDTLVGGVGVDTLNGDAGNDIITGNGSADLINGGAGTDTVLEARDANFTLTNTALTIGAEGTDTLTSIERANLTGGLGDNTFNIGAFSGRTTIFGDDGSDTLDFSAQTSELKIDLDLIDEQQAVSQTGRVLILRDAIENVIATDFNDVIYIDIAFYDRFVDGGIETQIPPGDRLIVDMLKTNPTSTKIPNGKLGSYDGTVNGAGYTGTINYVDIETLVIDNPNGGGGQGGGDLPIDFGAATDYPIANGPHGIVAADVNGDGILDMVVSGKLSGTVSVRFGNGFGGFGTEAIYNSGSVKKERAITVALSDLDNDGDLDIVVTNRLDNSVGVLLNNGAGVFTGPTTFSTGVGKLGKFPMSVKIGDMNNDGNDDIVTTNASKGKKKSSIAVLLGNGAGSFGAANTTPVQGRKARDLVLGDFNQDGNLDVVATNLFSREIVFFAGNGAGGIAAPVSFPTGWQPTSIISADFNGDGLLDVAVTCQVSKEISVLYGTGAPGIFSETIGIKYPSVKLEISINSADLNGDGNADLIIANRITNTLSYMLGLGNGTFDTRVDFKVGGIHGREPVAIAYGDLNNDGAIDLLVANAGTDDVSVLLRNPIV